MLWGGIGAGKTTLIKVLLPKPSDATEPASGERPADWRRAGTQSGQTATKTQMIEYEGAAIDTPGEYSEMGRMRRHLQTTAAEAQLLLVAQDATRAESFLPPNYFRMFRQPVLGVVTKIDEPSARPEQAIAILRHIGVTGKIFCVSSHTGEGIDALKSELDERRTQWLTQSTGRLSD
jgi:ethanolamine utilization protein EutP